MHRAIASLIVIGAVMTAPAVTRATQAGRDVTVTASFTGTAKVDETHEILVFLFDHPVPTADSIPLAVQAVQKNGGTVTFKDVSASPVYVVLVYDEKANYDGRSGPPPRGTPIGTYQKGGKPLPVTPGPNVKVSASFDDSRRWGQ
jgi:hypothetical protein